MTAAAANLKPDASIAAVVDLPRALPPVLGMGAYLKASLCRIEGARAEVTADAGDLATLDTVDRYEALLAALPTQALTCAAHDLHPDFYSTRIASTLGCPTLAVQHHHAHTLATAWEHGHTGPVIGLSLDGFGLGPGAQSWGGELLWVDGLDYRRLGHLALLPQPGGDVAAREPWRMGAAALFRLGRGSEIASRFADQPHAALLEQMLIAGLNAPDTSSCGRLFDAACGLLGVHPVAEFEGQAPMALERLVTVPTVMDGGWTLQDGVLDFSRLLARLAEMDPQAGADLLHGTLAAGMAAWVIDASRATALGTVAFGGGCFLNAVLTGLLADHLRQAGLTVLKPEKLSPGDAGLSFGQAIAAALWAENQGSIRCA